MLPGESNLSARLQGYITEADAQVVSLGAELQDRAGAAWVLYRFWSAVHAARLASPSTLTLSDQGGASYTDQQLRDIKAKADGYLAEFEVLFPTDTPIEAAPPGGATRTRVNW